MAVAERLMACFERAVRAGRSRAVRLGQHRHRPAAPRRPERRGPDPRRRRRDVPRQGARPRALRAVRRPHARRARSLRMRIENDLRRAVPGEDLRVHYQPIVALANGDLAGFEALMRWRHPRRGDVAAGRVHPDRRGERADRADRPLGARAGGRAGRALARPRRRPVGAAHGRASTCRPGRSAHGQFADEVADVLAATGLEPERLLLEITESMLMDEHRRDARGAARAEGARRPARPRRLRHRLLVAVLPRAVPDRRAEDRPLVRRGPRLRRVGRRSSRRSCRWPTRSACG